MNRKTNQQHITLVVGTRPNFMKAAPLCRALRKASVPYRLVHTGQHYDSAMAQQFLDDLQLQPDSTHLLRSRTPVSQISEMLVFLEQEYVSFPPRAVVVFGDVNSTLAGALAADKAGIPVVHVEAGLRSYNRAMPEETNRIFADHVAHTLFAVSDMEAVTLSGEGIPAERTHVVGNIMIDQLAHEQEHVGKTDEHFYFCTLHRAENVDNRARFAEILSALKVIAVDAPIHLPLHPRTRSRAEEFGLLDEIERIFRVSPPLSYRESVFYQKNAALVLTDSGGIQEETSFLGTPCLTLRTETERPITVEQGTNTVAGVTEQSILAAYERIQPLTRKATHIPLWDGRTAERIVSILASTYAL